MRFNRLFVAAIVIMAAALIPLTAGCSISNSSSSTASATLTTSVKPSPIIKKVVATTSGTQSAYYATLDIQVKNEGAEGTVLVQASITQDEKTTSNEMPVYLAQNETHELKLTFPLEWEGGEFTSTVDAIVP